MSIADRAKRGRWFTAKPSDLASATPSNTESPLATNGFLSTLLLPEERAALRQVNVRLTELAIAQCEAGGGAANQVAFGSQACTTLADDYWSSPSHDFVPFLVGVKNKYDPTDLFQFAQSIPLAV